MTHPTDIFTNTEAHAALTNAKLHILRNTADEFHFLHRTVLQTQHIESPDIPTLQTDGTIIKYSPTFCLDTPTELLAGVLLHEHFHKYCHHPYRVDRLLSTLFPHTPLNTLWTTYAEQINLATDAAINPLLCRTIPLPNPILPNLLPLPTSLIHPPTMESYLTALIEMVKPTEQQNPTPEPTPTPSHLKPIINPITLTTLLSQIALDLTRTTTEPTDAPHAIVAHARLRHADPQEVTARIDKALDTLPPSENTPYHRDKWTKALQSALNHPLPPSSTMTPLQPSGPPDPRPRFGPPTIGTSDLYDEIYHAIQDPAHPSTIPWRHHLAHIICSPHPDETWERPDPRYRRLRLYLPNQSTDTYDPILLLIDVSSSISTPDLRAFITEMHALLSLNPTTVYIATHNTSLVQTFLWQPNDGPFDQHIRTGGGTSHTASIPPLERWLAQLPQAPRLQIFFTDAMSDWPKDGPLRPTYLVTPTITTYTPSLVRSRLPYAWQHATTIIVLDP